MSAEVEDFDLLREYVANQSEPAFRALVERHVDMVYATALRQAGDAHLAEEATQAVFITLARKARGLSSSTILAGWLFRAAQFAAAKVQRTELRRKHWEQQAAQMEPNSSDNAVAWEQMAPQLNEALNDLKEPDRDALILRFFQSKSMAQVGSALGTSEGAAKMRVARALEQLRGIFQARGIALSVTLLAAALASATAQTAPTGLAASVTTSALLKSTTLPLITKGLLLFMNWNARKLAIAALIGLTLTSTTSTVVAVLLWQRQRQVAGAPEAPSPGEPALSLASDRGRGSLEVLPGKEGVMHVKTRDGDLFVTNGVNHFVKVDDQGRTNEYTVTAMQADGGGGSRIRLQSVRRGPGAPPPPPGTRGGGFGAGAGGPGGPGGPGGVTFGVEERVEEEVLVGRPPAAK